MFIDTLKEKVLLPKLLGACAGIKTVLKPNTFPLPIEVVLSPLETIDKVPVSLNKVLLKVSI